VCRNACLYLKVLLMICVFAEIINWSCDDVAEFLHHRGYSADVRKLFAKYKVNGRGLLDLVKDTKLLSELGLHGMRAVSLRNDVKHCNPSGIHCIVCCAYYGICNSLI